MQAPQTILGPNGLPAWECNPGTGSTTQTGTMQAQDIALGKESAPVTPAPGYLKIYSPDGESLWSLDFKGAETEISAGGGQAGGLDWFDVKDFGATGNGSTDDTAAILAATAAANTQGGGIVYFPWGEYLVSATISVPPYVFLVGETAISLNQFATPGTISRIIASAGWAPTSTTGIVSILSLTPGGWSQNTASCGLKNLFLDGSLNSSGNLQGVNLVGPVYDVHLEDVFIWKAPHDGITASGQTEAGIVPTFPYHQRYDRVTVADCGSLGFGLTNFTDSSYVNCLAFGNSSGAGFNINNCSNSVFTACRSEFNEYGFAIAGSAGSIAFTGCSTDQNIREGLYVNAATGQTAQGGGIIWSGGKLHADANGASSGHTYGIQINGSTVPVVICGTNVESGEYLSAYYPADALRITGASNVTVTGCVLQGVSAAYSAGTGNTDVIMVGNLGATGDPDTQTFSILPNLVAGSNTAQGAPVLTPTLANGTAAQLSDITQDYMVYLTVGTAGTALTISIGPTSVPAHTICSSVAATSGATYSFRVPAGWYVEWSATTATLATQLAIGC